MTEHLGDAAELYPLGMLDDDAVREVERHIGHCTECAERVAQAQLAAASLAAALPAATPSAALDRRLRESARPRRIAGQLRSGPSAPNLFRYALAAAIVLGFLALGWQTLVLRGRLASQDVALVTMVHSHFNHVSMAPHSASPVAAKILYARDGAWVYIIADEPGGSVHAIAHTAVGTTDLGVLVSTGETATLLVHPADRITSITLQRSGTNIASAKLTY